MGSLPYPFTCMCDSGASWSSHNHLCRWIFPCSGVIFLPWHQTDSHFSDIQATLVPICHPSVHEPIFQETSCDCQRSSTANVSLSDSHSVGVESSFTGVDEADHFSAVQVGSAHNLHNPAPLLSVP